MLMIKDALRVNVALVLKLNDFVTGGTITDYRGMHIVSGDGFCRPITKDNGFIVFTGVRPETVRITSDRYHDVLVSTASHMGSVLRLSLIPRNAKGELLSVGVGVETYVGFDSMSYPLSRTIMPDLAEIQLHKDDLNDITDMFHAIVTHGGETEIVYITKNKGNGIFALSSATKQEYSIRGTRLITLLRVFDINGKIPLPKSVKSAYIMSDGILRRELFS